MPLESVELASSVKRLTPNAGHDFDSAGRDDPHLHDRIDAERQDFAFDLRHVRFSQITDDGIGTGAGRLSRATGDQHAEDEKQTPQDAPNEEAFSGRPDPRRSWNRESSVNPRALPVRCNAWLGRQPHTAECRQKPPNAASATSQPTRKMMTRAATAGWSQRAGSYLKNGQQCCGGKNHALNEGRHEKEEIASGSAACEIIELWLDQEESQNEQRLSSGNRYEQTTQRQRPNEEAFSGRPDRRRAGAGRAV